MLRRFALFVLVGCNSTAAAPIATAPPNPGKPAAGAGKATAPPVDKASELITKKLVEMNANDKWAMPSRELHAGSVTASTPPVAKRTAHGFEVQFSNHSPVSTPAVYDGRVYSSGG